RKRRSCRRPTCCCFPKRNCSSTEHTTRWRQKCVRRATPETPVSGVLFFPRPPIPVYDTCPPGPLSYTSSCSLLAQFEHFSKSGRGGLIFVFGGCECVDGVGDAETYRNEHEKPEREFEKRIRPV